MRCNKCIMPKVKDYVTIDSSGRCSVCNKYEDTLKVEGQNQQPEGFGELKRKVEMLKKNHTGKYDCAVGISGGKDSMMILHIAKKELKLNPLAIFIDNGFALEEMSQNIESIIGKLGIDLITYRPHEVRNLFIHLLKSKKSIYYCRLCHELLDVYIREVASAHGVNLLLGGYTKGQEYVKSDELFWIYDISDKNVDEVLLQDPQFKEIQYISNNHAIYLYEKFESMGQVNPFQYIRYDEKGIIKFLTDEYGFKVPKKSWPADSTNCLFNYVSQHLAVKNFGYSQHETEVSTLVRKNEITRERALEVIEAPIPMEYIEEALAKLGLKYEDIVST